MADKNGAMMFHSSRICIKMNKKGCFGKATSSGIRNSNSIKLGGKLAQILDMDGTAVQIFVDGE